jgi:hypothetical protein
MHPSEWVNPPACDASTVGLKVHNINDGETWECTYDPVFGDYFWEPIGPEADTTDGVAWDTNNNTWIAPDGITHRTTSRVEFIKSVVKSGTDTFTRKPAASAFSEPAGFTAVYSQLWAWNGASWSLCRDGGWFYSKAAGAALAHTWEWGLAPCGYVWYQNTGWVANWNGSAWEVSPSAPSYGTAAGYTAYVGITCGCVFDPPPVGSPLPAPISTPSVQAPSEVPLIPPP